jgi:hypothetical protein
MHSHRASIALRALYFSAAFSICSMVFFNTKALAASGAGTVSIASSAYGMVQNLGIKTIVVNRTGGSSGAVTVLCRTVNGSALAGDQYTTVSNTLKWANGDSAPKTCTVPVSTTPYHGTKTFYVELSNATGAALGSPSKTTVSIYGNLGGGSASLSAPTYSVAQDAGGVIITVNRSNGSVGEACVSYATANITAIAGTNYAAEHGTLVWGNADAAPKTFRIPLNTATPIIGSKTLAVALAAAENVVLGKQISAIVTISGQTPAASGDATLSWSPPTTNTNGSPITDLAGYKIYYGKSAQALTSVLEVANPATVDYEIGNLGAGTWYFAVAAYNSESVESTLSPVVSKTN